MDEEVLSSADPPLDPADPDAVIDLLTQKVEEMIATAEKEYQVANGKKKMPKPLIRLKVEHTGFPTPNPQRFGQRFVGRVANPNEILLFYRKRSTTSSVNGNF